MGRKKKVLEVEKAPVKEKKKKEFPKNGISEHSKFDKFKKGNN